jgi:acyl dehydratase
MKVQVGDYAELERTFNGDDLKLFSEAIQDKYAAHKQDPINPSTFYRSDIVYGIFTSASFTALFRSYFPKAIYLSQDIKFRKPILRDEKVRAIVEIVSWDERKKDVTFKTIIEKVETKEVAVEG